VVVRKSAGQVLSQLYSSVGDDEGQKRSSVGFRAETLTCSADREPVMQLERLHCQANDVPIRFGISVMATCEMIEEPESR